MVGAADCCSEWQKAVDRGRCGRMLHCCRERQEAVERGRCGGWRAEPRFPDSGLIEYNGVSRRERGSWSQRDSLKEIFY